MGFPESNSCTRTLMEYYDCKLYTFSSRGVTHFGLLLCFKMCWVFLGAFAEAQAKLPAKWGIYAPAVMLSAQPPNFPRNSGWSIHLRYRHLKGAHNMQENRWEERRIMTSMDLLHTALHQVIDCGWLVLLLAGTTGWQDNSPISWPEQCHIEIQNKNLFQWQCK